PLVRLPLLNSTRRPMKCSNSLTTHSRRCSPLRRFTGPSSTSSVLASMRQNVTSMQVRRERLSNDRHQPCAAHCKSHTVGTNTHHHLERGGQILWQSSGFAWHRPGDQ